MGSAMAMDAALREQLLETAPDRGASVGLAREFEEAKLLRELAGALNGLEAGTLHLSMKAAADTAGPDTRLVALAQVLERLAKRVEMHDLALKDLATATKPTRRPWAAVPMVLVPRVPWYWYPMVMVLVPMVILGAATASKPLAALFEHSDVAMTTMPTLPPVGAPALRAETIIDRSAGQPPSDEADAAKSASAPPERDALVDSAVAQPATGDADPAMLKAAPTERDALVDSAADQPATGDADPAMLKAAPTERDALVRSSAGQSSDLDLQSPVTVAKPAADFAGTSAANGSRIVLRATADAWIQVRGKDNRIVLSRVLHKDETWPVPDESGLRMTTGNAGGTEILMDGVITPSLGGNGVVRTGVPLGADLLKADIGIDTPSAVALLKIMNTPAH
jgi:hypothetical protein